MDIALYMVKHKGNKMHLKSEILEILKTAKTDIYYITMLFRLDSIENRKEIVISAELEKGNW